ANQGGVTRLGELAALNSALPAASRFSALAGVATADMTPVDHNRLLSILDANANGVIDVAEAAKLLGGDAAALARAKAADLDGDGKIDPLGYEVNTGGKPIYLGMDSPLIRAQGFLQLNVFNVVTLVGNFRFGLGPTQNVKIKGGTRTDDTVTTMMIGASNVNAFIGWNGPYFKVDAAGNPIPGQVNPNAKGLALTNLDVGIFLGLS